MNFERLELLARTPRVLDESVDKIRERPMFFMRAAVKAWEREMRTAPLVFAYVVHAETALFEPGAGGMGRAVLLHSEEPGYSRNSKWLSELAARVWALRMVKTSQRDALELGMMLVDENSEFSLPVPLNLTRLIFAQVSSHTLNVELLPNQCIPYDRVIPALASSNGLFPLPAELWE
jgi:hypothetical protein